MAQGYIKQFRNHRELVRFLTWQSESILRIRLEFTINGNPILWFTAMEHYAGLPTFPAERVINH